MKEIKDDINRWRDIPYSWVGRINIVKNDYTTKCNLQIQCDPYQITNGIFHRTRTKNFTIYMATQKTPNNQSNPEKVKWSCRNQLPWLQTLLQNYSNQKSMVLAQNQKYRSMEQARKPGNKSMHQWSINLWQSMQNYTTEKRQALQQWFLENWVLLVKEWI